MKFKYSILIGMTTLLSGFIPLSFSQKNDIKYTIYSQSIVNANKIKEELMVFYKQYCYSFSFNDIDKKIVQNIDNFQYDVTYDNYNIIVNYSSDNKIKMTGYLFKNTPSFIDFKYYFSMIAVSMPEAISTSVATLSVSDQI